MSRPEHIAPPELFYNETEAKKYTENSRITTVQTEMAYRALELLNLDQESAFLLDLGCGSGLSGEVLEESGHVWVGLDISPSMLHVALDRGVEGDLFEQDLGQGVGFRPGVFDGAISISVLQWLCNADKTSHEPKKRIQRFFTTLYSVLARGARAVFQFYPENSDQVDMLVSSAMRAGFSGGLVIDYPNSTRAKKTYLVLMAGYAHDPSNAPKVPKGLQDESSTIAYTQQRQRHSKQRKPIKDKDWVLRKKELNRKRGKEVPLDSKYTARKRRPKF
jgi:18S rRNA (guanine1575-N7)-methyltransferase